MSNNIDLEIITEKTIRLNKIKNNIEKMDKTNQIGVLYLVTKNKNIKYSENNNGIFINLTDLNDNIINILEEYIKYIELQTCDIDNIEEKKVNIENIYFKLNKE